MQITDVSNTSINWDDIPISRNSGETGNSYQRTVELGNVRLKMVEYSPGYKADHWCCRGHIIHLLDGEMKFECKDGSMVSLKKGMSCCFSDSKAIAHKSLTETGAFLLIID